VLFRWDKYIPELDLYTYPSEKTLEKSKQLLCSKLFGQNISTPLPKGWNFEEA